MTVSATGQRLIVNKKDEFTGNHVKETSVEKLAHPFKMNGFAYNFSAKRVNETFFLNLHMMSLNKEVFAVRKDSRLMIRLKNDSVVTLFATEFDISGRGKAGSGLSSGNAEGASIYYPISADQIKDITESDIVKIRVYTTDGFTEQGIKKNGSEKVKKAFNLLQ
jgi:hypothetical protein